MPYMNAVGGSWRTARVFRIDGEVIRLDVTLGTTNEATAKRYEEAIETVARLGRASLLRSIMGRNRTRTAKELYELVRSQKLANVAEVQGDIAPLIASLNAWLPTAMKKSGVPISDVTRDGYARTIKNFARFVPKDAKVKDLPRLYSRFRAEMMAESKHKAVLKTRAMLQAFARGTQDLGAQSDLWRELAALPSAPTKRKRDRAAMMPWEAFAMFERMSDKWRRIARFMCMTGCNASEYVNGFEIHDDYVVIHGTKNEWRANRVVPKLAEDFFPKDKKGNYVIDELPPDYRGLNPALKAASGNDAFVVTDLRATFRVWCREAGIPDFRAEQYMGHRQNNVAAGYQTTDPLHFIEEDTERLVRYLSANRTPPKATTKRVIERLSF